MHAFLKLLRDRRGVGAVEFAFIASLISVAAVVAFHHMGERVQSQYEHVDEALPGGTTYDT